MKPYYQGQLDLFCAIYSVINAISLTKRIRFETARTMFSDTILKMSENREHFSKQLTHDVEYYDLVDEMLEREKDRYNIKFSAPFANKKVKSHLAFEAISEWLKFDRTAVIIRFERVLALPNDPRINHWTTLQDAKDGELIFFDCSRDDGAIHSISNFEFITDKKELKHGLIYVDLDSVRFVG